jgi:DNA-binding NtrC family response regulator
MRGEARSRVGAGSLAVLLVEPDDAWATRIAGVVAPRVALLERVRDAAGAFARLTGGAWDVVIAAAELPDLESAALARWVAATASEAAVVLLARRATAQEAVRSMLAGAALYRAKGPDLEATLATDLAWLARRRNPEAEPVSAGFAGASVDAARVRALVADYACEASPVLVTGESGTGKDVVARALHERSPRGEGPFVAVNCAAIPEALFEGELFGASRGAYTGADRDRKGLLGEACGGTIFLDEIAELPLATQAKLLRFLDGGRVRPVGGSAEEELDVRVVAATHRDLERMVRSGTFREDLWFRLDVLRVHIPPLRARPADVPLLALHFAECAVGPGVRFGSRAVADMLAFPWPGNARQVQNVVLRALARQGHDIESLERELGAGGSPHTQLDELLRRHAGDLGEVSRALGVSRRTVQRRLARVGLRAAAYRSTVL